jgi:ribosomal protein S18 acetylase RimI-like enzyme
VQRAVVANLLSRPEPAEVGPFVCGFDPATDSRYINYATPRPEAAIGATDVAELVAAFRKADRVPRLEYVTSCAPGLEQLLLDAGFAVEARHEYLVCSPGSLVTPPLPDGFEFAVPATDEQRAAAIAAQNEAFGEEPVATAGDVARIRRTQDNGGVMVMVRETGGEVVGAGLAVAPVAGVSEVAGIAVREAYRRRGIAGALTAAITDRLFAAGVDVAWLEAAAEDSWRVYERVGYVPSGKRLYIALG